MTFEKNWKIIDTLGTGGQGIVYQAIRVSDYNESKKKLFKSIRDLNSVSNQDNIDALFDLFRDGMMHLLKLENPNEQGALKVLHSPEDARDANLAEERIKNEIIAMSNTQHPNLLKILEIDPDYKWFVSEYHHKRTLIKNNHNYIGDSLSTLKKVRSLVEGVSKLHSDKIVHRDIKPQNIFVSKSDELILGDFGLVFFSDAEHTRISATYENVGTRDWMPAWATGMRIEQIKPSFDVFCLGKLIWSMLYGSLVLRLWYHRKDQFNLEVKYPNRLEFKIVNDLLDKCIVEDEENCIPSAVDLLSAIDETIYKIEKSVEPLSKDSKRKCKVCGVGEYWLATSGKNITDVQNFGFDPRGNRTMRITVCGNCGHTQIFSFDDGELPRAWID